MKNERVILVVETILVGKTDDGQTQTVEGKGVQETKITMSIRSLDNERNKGKSNEDPSNDHDTTSGGTSKGVESEDGQQHEDEIAE